MRQSRFLAPWRNSTEKPALYHLVSRVVERRFAFGVEEKERFRTLMRMMERFSGCRVLTYCVMSNHVHILLEVPPMQAGGLGDAELLARLGVLYSEAFVAGVAKELEDARKEGDEAMAAEIHKRFTYRMHDLGQFMKGLLQRFSQWFNGRHQRTGTLWEQRFKSVIVESGVAARTIAAYIDLNPVRAGMVSDPADYRWSGYGEAVGGGKKGNGKKSREGIVRACMSHKGAGFEAEKWKEVSRIYRRAMGMALERKPSQTQDLETQDTRKEGRSAGMNDAEYLEGGADRRQPLPELSMAKMLRCRVRYFTDGAVIGSKEFVNEAFVGARERFSERRRDGARRMRGSGAAAKGVLWSMRDLRVGI